jgi:hypothetical protein
LPIVSYAVVNSLFAEYAKVATLPSNHPPLHHALGNRGIERDGEAMPTKMLLGTALS